MRRIPALVVTGFLGSGKTSLVRRLLDAAQVEGARVAFISNEFGQLGVDRALLGGDDDSMVEIAGGCICCALNDELYQTLVRLRERVDPDRLVIETSGLAVPSEVQLAFYQHPIRDWVGEEAVVTVVSADQLHCGEHLGGVFDEQIETADLVVLNKVDLVPPGVQDDLRARVRERCPGVPVVRAEHCDVDLRLLFSTRATGSEPQERGGRHHHERYESREVVLAADLDVAEVEARLRALGAVRVKGFVRAEGRAHLVQGVGRRIEITPSPVPVDPALLGRVAVILPG